MEAQVQIRNNARDVEESLKDLMQWQKEAQQKDRRLKQQKTAQPSSSAPAEKKGVGSGPPPIRGRHAAHAPPVLRELQGSSLPVTRSAAKSQSGDGSSKDTDSKAMENEVVARPRQPAKPQSAAEQANSLKDQGNRFFQQGLYKEAQECYTASLTASETCLGYANRAMTLLKLGYHKAAEEDCTQALRLDPSYLKAYQRRGTARKALGRFLEAAADFEAALRLQPGSQAITEERASALAAALSERGLAPLTQRTPVPIQRDTAEAGPPAALPVPSKHVEQQPASATSPMTTAAPSTESATASTTAELRGTTEAKTAETREPVPESSSRPPQGNSAAAAQAPTTSTTDTRVSPPDDAGTTQASANGVAPKEAAAPRNGAAASPSMSAALAAAAAAAAQVTARPTSSVHRAPKTGTEFEVTWKGLRGQPAAQATYLTQLQPSAVPALFKHSLTAGTLKAIVTALLVGVLPGDPKFAVELLEGLAKVPRFSMMAAMCFPGAAQRQEALPLWEAAEAAVAGQPEFAARLGALRKSFNV